jgi:hypothetical protein
MHGAKVKIVNTRAGARVHTHTHIGIPKKHKVPMARSTEVVKVVSLFHIPCLFVTDLPKNKTTFDAYRLLAMYFP